MKPTIKVSIGGFAFNLEEDAYLQIDDYLKHLNNYFKNSPEGEEIIADIEARMAELLHMRVSDKNGVITVSDASDIISIMGNPKDFNNDQVDQEDYNKREDNPVLKRKLYRDPDHGIIGGVCSGLGYYFRIDPVILRIIFVALLLFSPIVISVSSIFPRSSRMQIDIFIIILYIVLWIVMPKAKTLMQKISMSGADPSIENIESRTQLPLRRTKSSGLLKAIKIFFGIILGLICLSLIITLISIIAAFFGFYVNTDYPAINDILDIFSINSLDMKIMVLMALLLPIIGLCYLCFKLLLQSRFTTRDVVISVLATLLWIGACCYMGGAIWSIASKYERKATATETVNITTLSDSLYVKISGYNNGEIKSLFDKETELYYSKNNKRSSILFFPQIEIRKDSMLSAYKLEIKKTAFHETREQAKKKARNFAPSYQIEDSLIVLTPIVYNKLNPWNREFYKIIITAPAGKEVIIENP